MGYFDALIYDLVQGATEYLPVSSSAHLLLVPHVLGQNDPGLAFDVFLHIGTLLATAVYFFKDWLQILRNPVPAAGSEGRGSSHLSWLHLVVGTIPAVVAGLLLNHWIKENTRSLLILWATLPLFGVFLWWVDKHSFMNRTMKSASLGDMLVVGCMQALALIPGVSRSGSTITAARLLGFTRADSARISFLLSLPVTLGAIVLEVRHWEELVASANGLGPLVFGAATALVSGALAIHLLIRWVSRTSFAVFAVYRVIIAVLIAISGLGA
jgi:undecaprenyl-diphosphatase